MAAPISIDTSTETKAERLERTRKEFGLWLDERLATPLSEFKPLDIDAIEAEYAKRK